MEYRAEGGHVQVENLQFLVLMRPTQDIAAWAFLDLSSMNTLFDHLIDTIDHPELSQVALSVNVDDQGFSMITLNTSNMEIFNQVRSSISCLLYTSPSPRDS